MAANALLTFIVLFALGSIAWGQDTDQKPDQKKAAEGVRQACKDDVTKFCKDVKVGGGRIIDCLHEHSDEVSPNCKSRLKGRLPKSKS